MRIALVAHGFPPEERTGVENHTAQLAAALSRAGEEVEVFAPRVDRTREHLALAHEARGAPSREGREGRDGFHVTWIATNRTARTPREALDPPRIARVFATWLAARGIDLVHFQHVHKLGLALIHAAARAGLAVVYTAHDYFPVTSEYTLLAPDLSPLDPADDRAMARCDLARSFLDRIARLGDHHGFALPEDLDPEARASLHAILHGDPANADCSRETIEEAVRERRDLELRRREAFARVDLLIAPTRHVADALRAGGLGRVPMEIDPCGIDLEPFIALRSTLAKLATPAPPRRSAREGPIRFGFLGGVLKHKGVHVLLESFAGLDRAAELHVFGSSKDRAYVERVRREAERVAASWHGPYEARDAARCLAQIDALVVPSIWPENAPFVIREAFAAGRPVIASRIGALAESVREDVDGLFFEAGDARALRETLRRCIDENGLLARLARGIRPVRSIDDQAQGLAARYAALVREKRERPARLPAHLSAFAARVRHFEEMPSGDLAEHVYGGLEKLRVSLLGAKAVPEELLARAVFGRSSIPRTLAALEKERDWLAAVVADKEAVLDVLARRAAWLEDRVGAREVEAAELERKEQDHARARAALEKEARWQAEIAAARALSLAEITAARDALGAARDALAAEVGWLRRSLEDAQRAAEEAGRTRTQALAARDAAALALEEAQRQRDGQRDLVRTREREVAWLEETLAERERRLEWLDATLAERDRRLESLDATVADRDRRIGWLDTTLAERGREIEWRTGAQAGQAQVIHEQAADLQEKDRELARRQGAIEDRDREIASRSRELGDLRREIQSLKQHARHLEETVEGLRAETGWRRQAMRAVKDDVSRSRIAWLVRGLRARVESWPEEDPGESPRVGPAASDPPGSPEGAR